MLATTIVLYALLFPLFRQTLNWQTSDFTACYRAGQMVGAGQGAQVYNYDAASNYGPALEAQMAATHQHLVLKRFVSAPFVLLIFAPLSYLSHYHAEIVWYVINVCLMLAWPLLLLKVLKGKVLVFALLGPVFFIPVVVGMVQGQTSTLTLFLFALCYVSLREGRPVLAGSALAMAAIKPQFVIPALLVLVLCKYWKAVGSFFATSLGLLALSSLLVGWRTALSYPAAWIRFNVLPREMLRCSRGGYAEHSRHALRSAAHSNHHRGLASVDGCGHGGSARRAAMGCATTPKLFPAGGAVDQHHPAGFLLLLHVRPVAADAGFCADRELRA